MARRPQPASNHTSELASAPEATIEILLNQALTEIEATQTPVPPTGEEDAWSRCLRRDRSAARQRLIAIRELLPAVERRDMSATVTAASLAIEAAHTAATVVRSDSFAHLSRCLHGRWQDLTLAATHAAMGRIPRAVPGPG